MTPGRRQHCLLWDVDGTLIGSGGAGSAAFDRLFRHRYGWTGALAPIRLHGLTDPLIVRAVFQHQGQDVEESEIAACLEEYLQFLAQTVQETASSAVVHPGIRSLLQRLRGMENLALGLLTGNLREGARLKLSIHNLWSPFAFGAFGEDAPERQGLVPVALERARARTGIRYRPEETWVIGDTPRDAACARAHGARICLVGTNRAVERDALEACEPDLYLDDFSDPSPLLHMLNRTSQGETHA